MTTPTVALIAINYNAHNESSRKADDWGLMQIYHAAKETGNKRKKKNVDFMSDIEGIFPQFFFFSRLSKSSPFAALSLCSRLILRKRRHAYTRTMDEWYCVPAAQSSHKLWRQNFSFTFILLTPTHMMYLFKSWRRRVNDPRECQSNDSGCH